MFNIFAILVKLICILRCDWQILAVVIVNKACLVKHEEFMIDRKKV